MKLFRDFINKNSAFIAIGSFIGTLIFIGTFHSMMFFDDPSRFLHGLITPHIIFPMLVAFILVLPFGYLIGLLPALISKLLFEHFFAVKIGSANFFRATFYGFALGLMWSPLILIIVLAMNASVNLFLYMEFVLILPVCLMCTWVEWKKAKNQIPNGLNVH